MMENKYSEAAVEVLDILNYTDKNDLKNIPQSFIKFLSDISNKNYKVQFNHEYPISGLNLKEETKELLGFIYITWWANKEEREDYRSKINMTNTIDEIETKKYDIDDIFKNRKSQVQTIVKDKDISETSMIEYKDKNLLEKIFDKILSLFMFQKKREE